MDTRMWSAAARLLGTIAFSNVGDGVLRLAVPLIVLRQDNSASSAALAATALMAPWLALALPVGSWLDRGQADAWNRRANSARTVILLTVTGIATQWMPSVAVWVAVSFGLGALEVVADLAAQSITPSVVPDEVLAPLNGTISGVQLISNQFLGPAIGGFAVAELDATSLTIAAALYAGAALMVPGVPHRGDESDEAQRQTVRLSSGLRYFASRRDLLVLAGVVGSLNLNSGIVLASLPGFGLDQAGVDERTLGLLIAISGIGGVLGSLLASRTAAGARSWTLVSPAALVIAVAPVALVASPSATAIGLALGVSAFATPFCAVAVVTHRQRSTPRALLGCRAPA